MKNYLASTMTLFALILTLAFSGTVFAESKSKGISQPMTQGQDAGDKDMHRSMTGQDAADKDMHRSMTQGQDTADYDSASTTISGTINESNQLIDLQGKAIQLSDNTDEGMEVKALIGQKVELKGTVLDEDGEQVMEVLEYRLLEK